MTEPTTHTPNKALIDAMFGAGAHYAYNRSRRHPSAKPFIFGVKNRVEIFDLEKTSQSLEKAKEFVKSIGATGKQILFVAGKSEARDIIKQAAQSLGLPYVAGRWIGGTFTNFVEIRRRIERMESLMSQREKGELGKYTKKERLLIDREIETLERFFSGLASMKEFPKAIFVIDQKREHIAVTEALKTGIPVVSISGSDCDIREVQYPVPGNDVSVTSIAFFVKQIADAYAEGKKSAPAAVAAAPAASAPVSHAPAAHAAAPVHRSATAQK